jgi:hypothetical protein
MGWLEEGMRFIADLKEKSDKKSVIEIGGIKYKQDLNNGLTRLPSELDYDARIDGSTLDSLIEYVKKNKDGFAPADVLIHIYDHDEVRVVTYKREYYNDRKLLFNANRWKPQTFFNQGLSLEQFKIFLMTGFVQTAEIKDLMNLVSRVKAVKEDTTEETGFSQKVEVKKGIDLTETGKIIPIFELAPFRTFTEVAQPVSPFLFRISGEGNDLSFSLRSADGGAWRNQAIKNIMEYLKANLPKETLILP